MNQTPSYVNVAEIKAKYAPYNTFPEFEQGYTAYMSGMGKLVNLDGVAGQAYDRGAEAAMKVKAATRRVEQNVGSN